MVDIYYNSGRFSNIVAEMVAQFSSAFAFYEALADFYTQNGHDVTPPGKIGYYDILGAFLQARGIVITQRMKWLCRYDLLLHERPARVPEWVDVDGERPYRSEITEYFKSGKIAELIPLYAGVDSKRLAKLLHVEIFPFHPESGEETPCAFVFDYQRRDIAGRAAVYRFH